MLIVFNFTLRYLAAVKSSYIKSFLCSISDLESEPGLFLTNKEVNDIISV